VGNKTHYYHLSVSDYVITRTIDVSALNIIRLSTIWKGKTFTGKTWNSDKQDILYFYVITLSSRLLKYIDKNKDDYVIKIDNYINAIDELSIEMQALAVNCIISNKKVMLYMGKNRKLMNSIRKVLR